MPSRSIALDRFKEMVAHSMPDLRGGEVSVIVARIRSTQRRCAAGFTFGRRATSPLPRPGGSVSGGLSASPRSLQEPDRSCSCHLHAHAVGMWWWRLGQDDKQPDNAHWSFDRHHHGGRLGYVDKSYRRHSAVSLGFALPGASNVSLERFLNRRRYSRTRFKIASGVERYLPRRWSLLDVRFWTFGPQTGH